MSRNKLATISVTDLCRIWQQILDEYNRGNEMEHSQMTEMVSRIVYDNVNYVFMYVSIQQLFKTCFTVPAMFTKAVIDWKKDYAKLVSICCQRAI